MINSKCKHKITGQEGIIKGELKGNDKFPDQWGIYWTFQYNSEIPNHYYWNDQQDIEIIKTKQK
jgi:hypothetical protein